MSRPARARSLVLAAAARLLETRPPAAFTLEAVAATAGISKGGLLYHFASKEQLLEALVADEVRRVDERLAEAAASHEPGAFARAYLETTMPADSGAESAPPTAGLVAAVALDPRLLDPLREAYGRWQARLDRDGVDPAVATAVRLAADGWWLAVLVGVPTLPPGRYEQVRDLLDSLTRPRG